MEEEIKVRLREEHDKITKLIIAIDSLDKTKEWITIKELLLDGLVEKTKLKIQQEACNQKISNETLYRLQGELNWVRRYADLKGYASTLKLELEGIKKRL